MADRVVVGDVGGGFMLRVSKPGYNAYSAPPEGLTFHENMRPLVPAISGYVWVPGGTPNGDNITSGQVTVGLGMGFSFPPKVLVRNSANRISVAAHLNMDNGQLTIFNDTPAAVLARYFVFMPF